ncbi:MAG: hypothetical protein DWQ01_09040 [Planctomycetota bacterium]|nr:MAG: hypothetical protein DWQ01_09040 [Planctomycetota bacterium]
MKVVKKPHRVELLTREPGQVRFPNQCMCCGVETEASYAYRADTSHYNTGPGYKTTVYLSMPQKIYFEAPLCKQCSHFIPWERGSVLISYLLLTFGGILAVLSIVAIATQFAEEKLTSFDWFRWNTFAHFAWIWCLASVPLAFLHARWRQRRFEIGSQYWLDWEDRNERDFLYMHVDNVSVGRSPLKWDTEEPYDRSANQFLHVWVSSSRGNAPERVEAAWNGREGRPSFRFQFPAEETAKAFAQANRHLEQLTP